MNVFFFNLPHLSYISVVGNSFRLIQEDYADDPWAVVVCCICLNRTRGSVALPVIQRLFETYQTPIDMKWARQVDLADALRPIGLHNRRAATLKRFSHDYVHMPIYAVRRMHGVGQYAYEAYRQVCLGDFSFRPKDKELLRRYMQEMSTV